MHLETLKFFPEPVFKYKFEKFKEFNKELEKYIYDLYEKDKQGVIRSNQGGWHSKNFKINEQNSIQNKLAVERQKYNLNVYKKYGWKTEKVDNRIKQM